MIGPLEIAVLIILILLVFGGRKLPQLGRSAGTGARKLGDTAMRGSEKAKVLAAETKEKHGDKLDPGALAQQAGKSAREAREFKDSFTGAGSSSRSRRPSRPRSRPRRRAPRLPSSRTSGQAVVWADSQSARSFSGRSRSPAGSLKISWKKPS